MVISEGKKADFVDYYTMREMTEGLVAKGIITQEMMDTAMERIASAYAALLEKKFTSFTVTAEKDVAVWG